MGRPLPFLSCRVLSFVRSFDLSPNEESPAGCWLRFLGCVLSDLHRDTGHSRENATDNPLESLLFSKIEPEPEPGPGPEPEPEPEPEPDTRERKKYVVSPIPHTCYGAFRPTYNTALLCYFHSSLSEKGKGRRRRAAMREDKRGKCDSFHVHAC